jgi:hypothetical protein
MSELSKDLYNRCRSVLLQCAEYEQDATLRAVFVTDELRPFQDGLPQATRRTARVDACLDYLLPKRLSDGRPALPLLLAALRDRYAEGDALRDALGALVEPVQIALSRAEHPERAHLFICYKRQAEPDQSLAFYLRDALTAQGHKVFIDQSMRAGDAWLAQIDREIQASDFLIVLLSQASADSEMVRGEVHRAYEYRQAQGKPRTLPVRVAYEGMLPYAIATFVNPLQYIVWRDESESQRVAQDILSAIAGKLPQGAALQVEDGTGQDDAPPAPSPEFDPRILKALTVPGGAIPSHDPFYVSRDADARLKAQIIKHGSTTTIRAPRQTGKTSLLFKGIHHAHEHGLPVVFVDFQSWGSDRRASLDVFLRELAACMCDELDLDTHDLARVWQEQRSGSKKLLHFVEKCVLPALDLPLVLAMDEADSLLQTNFYRDFFGLLRAWHNRRAHPLRGTLWQKLNLVLVISTEPYLLIDDVHQSPFNVGLDLSLDDFDARQVRDLNRRHGSPVAEGDLGHLLTLLHGHPFLTRRALYAMVSEGLTWSELSRVAPTDGGPFGDHLRRQYWAVRDRPELKKALKEIVASGRCSDDMALFRLLRAGLVKGSGDAYTCRCRLYKRYFEEKLSGE